MTPAPCALCGLPTGARPIARAEQLFCCAGCVNVYTILLESGAIASGQDFRSTDLYRQSLKLGLIARPDSADASPIPPDAETREAAFQVSGMWCGSCGWLIEHALGKLRGVASAEVLFASDLLKVRYCPQYLPRERILDTVKSLGYTAGEYAAGKPSQQQDLVLRLGIAAFLWMNVMTFSLVVYARFFDQVTDAFARYVPFLLMGLAAPAVFWCAWPILRAAWIGLRQRMLRMESLLALGLLMAYGYSVVQTFRGDKHVYFDTACAIVTLVLLGKLIERAAKEKTAESITLLYRLMPGKARLLHDGRERFVSIEALEPGAVFLVKSGERIPADGVVVEGRSHADESVLTGESAPRAKAPGDTVVCGSINSGGVLEIRATRTASDSTLAQMIRMVEQALATRSDVERQVDRVARIFTPAVIAVAALTFAGWLLAGAGAGEAILHAIAVLVIACPCALGIATPLAITAAVGHASRRGILVSDTRVLETVRRVDVLVMDKTGTVTDGEFRLLEIAGDQSRMPQLASLEARSEHPLGKAVAREYPAVLPVTDVRILEGQGIRGVVEGAEYFAGNRALAPPPPGLDAAAREWESQGRTIAFFGWDGEVRGAMAFGDRVKSGAAPLCAELKRRAVRTLLLSGDGEATVRHTAATIGADDYVAEALPTRKLDVIRELQAQGKVVAMIGDGVNDAPALAQADLGIALGSGTDIAMRAAPLVLMNRRLEAVAEVFDLSHRTHRIVRQNLFWAFFYNAAGITLAIAGVLNPILAAGAMVLSSLSVIWNSRRLHR
jgi:heavy metal translocating P-type ATPase